MIISLLERSLKLFNTDGQQFNFTDNSLINGQRAGWLLKRREMESLNYVKASPGRQKSIKKWFIFSNLIRVLSYFLKMTPLFKIGNSNARNIKVKHVVHQFVNLPVPFNGLSILHLSDLHLQERPDVIEKILSLVKGYKVDLLLFTGDFGTQGIKNFTSEEIAQMAGKVHDRINPTYGSFGVLGNHDHSDLVQPLEQNGVRLLINECVDIRKDGQSIRIIGTDDPHYYYTEESKVALSKAIDHFSVALVHTPELFDMASSYGVDLYLSGHSHGGQICLPFGFPIVTHINSGKRFFKGSWEVRGMKGYTSSGAGTVALPVRFNSPGEITFHLLRR